MSSINPGNLKDEYRFTTTVSVASGKNVYSGFAAYVHGSIGQAFTIAEATGVMLGLFNISIAPKGIAVFEIEKTTSVNNGSLALSATKLNVSAQAASKLAADAGFTIVTASDGKVYRMLDNREGTAESSYKVIVNSSKFEYNLNITQSQETYELFTAVDALLGNVNWRKRWEEVQKATDGKDVDVVKWVYENYPDTRGVIDGCRHILGEVPVVTYELTSNVGVDTEGPVFVTGPVTSVERNTIKAKWSATDNFFVDGYNYILQNENGVTVSSGATRTELLFMNDLSMGNYTLSLQAYDYSGNKSDWITSGNIIIPEDFSGTFQKGFSGDLQSGETDTYSLSISEAGIYRWIDIVNLSYNGKMTFSVLDAYGKTKVKMDYQSGKSNAKTWDFLLEAGEYTITVKSDKNCDYTLGVEAKELSDGNDSFDTATVLQLENATTSVTGNVGGEYDSKDYYQLVPENAGSWTVSLNSITANASLEIFDVNRKRIFSTSVKPDTKKVVIPSLLVKDPAYFVITSQNAKEPLFYSFSVTAQYFPKPSPNSTIETAKDIRLYGDLVNSESNVSLASDEWVGFGNPENYYLIQPEASGSYNFNFPAITNKLKITVLTETGKKIASKTLTPKNSAGGLNSLYLELGRSYYVRVENPDHKKGLNGTYTLSVRGDAFVRANQIPEDTWSSLKRVEEVTDRMKVVIDSPDAVLVENEWVGFTDALDVREITLTEAGNFTINLEAYDQARMTLFSADSSGKMKSLKKISVTKNNVKQVGALKNLLLEKGTYYLAVESTDATKGGNAEYKVLLDPSVTEIFQDANMVPEDNDPVTAPTLDCGEKGTLVSREWVGFSDKYDYFKIQTGEGGVFEFSIGNAEDQLRLKVFEAKNMKTVKSVTSSSKNSWNAATGSLVLGKDTAYIVAVEAPNASSGKGSHYDLVLDQSRGFKWNNNTFETAEAMEASGLSGIVSKAKNSDTVDYIDIQDCESLFVQLSEGKVSLSFYDKNKNLIGASGVNSAGKTQNSKKFQLNAGSKSNDTMSFASVDNISFMKIDAGGSGSNQYTLSFSK